MRLRRLMFAGYTYYLLLIIVTVPGSVRCSTYIILVPTCKKRTFRGQCATDQIPVKTNPISWGVYRTSKLPSRYFGMCLDIIIVTVSFTIKPMVLCDGYTRNARMYIVPPTEFCYGLRRER